MKWAPALLAVVALATLLPRPAQAQFSATPAIVRLGGTAEAAELAVVRVRNEGAEPMQFRIYLSDYDQSESGDFRFQDYGAGRGTCGARLSAFPEAAVLQPGAVHEVRVRLEGGGPPCWGLLFVESSDAADGQLRVAQRIGVRIVESGRGVADGEIEDVAVRVAADSLDVAVLFASVGTAPVELKGTLEVRSVTTGEVVRTAELGPLGVLPATRRRIAVQLANGLPAGRYIVVPIIDFGADFLAGGQAEIVIR